ncbi:MAG: 2Fe-2S iron-sulfur cluster-binding protein [Planctomycetota bacterium]|nr:2Fe-2S iron-sulfur cluster-binding protein [Planctomycetota bacterium]
MPKIMVDGKSIDCKPGQMILQACLDHGIVMPYYCYHPGLSIVASCRICLVEVEGIPKLVPACQTPVREGMVVHASSSKAIANQKAVMEYLLINHPLDCPVCDQAGECYLQDYSYQYGRSESRFEEEKHKKPKKDVGQHVLLYNDRCIMCSRCVRFTREISGGGELYVQGRGAREEIDIFPGRPLDNKLSGNVVDICPVGALLDKDFLFKQRVWLLKQAASVSPVDSGGENIYLDYNEGVIYRIKPRYNGEVNQWWISDDTRYSYKIVRDPRRVVQPMRMQYGSQIETTYDRALEMAAGGLQQVVATGKAGSLYAVLSPMMACEEAWLLGQYMRRLDPKALLVLGPVLGKGEDEVFCNSLTGKQTFVIKGEKVPNAKGVRRVMEKLGGPTATFEEFVKGDRAEVKEVKGGWIVGGYLGDWVPKDLPAGMKKGFRVMQDILPTVLAGAVEVVLPGAAWAEKEGCWENHQGRLQAFEAAVVPPVGCRREGDVYMNLLGRAGLYNGAGIRKEMGEPFESVRAPVAREEEAAFEFVEL